MSAVPRVAESIDDLRPGQVVVAEAHGKWYEPLTVDDNPTVLRTWFTSIKGVGKGQVVILSEPPEPLVRVPNGAYDRVMEAARRLRSEHRQIAPGAFLTPLQKDARDLLDALSAMDSDAEMEPA